MSVILVYSNRCREYTSCGRATTLRTLLCVLTTQLCVVCFALVSLWHFPCRWTMKTTSTPGTRRTTTRRRRTMTRTRRNKNTERIKREGWGIYKRKDFSEKTHVRNWSIGLIYWCSFSPAAMLSSLFFTPSVTSHVSYMDIYVFKMWFFGFQWQLQRRQCVHLRRVHHQSVMIFTSLVFIVMYCHVVFILTHKSSGKKLRGEDLKCSKNATKQIWYYSHFLS